MSLPSALSTDLDPAPVAARASAAPMPGRGSLLAGVAGYGWTSLLQLVSTPLLLHLLGPESLGLVGFYIAVQGTSRVLDLGLSPTVNRQLARAAAERRAQYARDFLLTVERGYWAIGLALGAGIALLAPLLASHWVGQSALSASALQWNVALIGVLVAIQWPITLYEGGLVGLQRIPTLHLIGVAMRTTGVAAGLVAVHVGPRALWVYFLGIAGASLLHVVLLARALRRALPPAERPARWSPGLVHEVWRFAAGLSVMSLLGLLLIHADKLLLSRLLPLADFGYYTLASLMATGLYALIMPAFQALFPALSGRVALGDAEGERDAYHLGAQSLAVLVLPAAAVLFLFAPEIVHVWTGSADTASRVAPVARLLLVGTALNGLMNAPYALQLAHGWTRIGVGLHVGLLVGLLPATVVAATRWGAMGAAAVWIAINAAYLLAGVPWTHRRVLRGEAGHWLVHDVLRPGMAGIGVAAAGWLLLGWLAAAPLVTVAGAAVTLLAAWGAAALAANRIRRWIVPVSASLRRRSIGALPR